jgi:hypothetical protein
VLKIAKQPFYRWLANPKSDRDWSDAQLTNAAIDIHRDDPVFGCRFIVEARRPKIGLFRDRVEAYHLSYSATVRKQRTGVLLTAHRSHSIVRAGRSTQ